MDGELIRLVKERAHHCCEYCGLPERYSSIGFEIDHIVAQQHGGKTRSGNLALACFADNLAGVGSHRIAQRAALIAVLQMNAPQAFTPCGPRATTLSQRERDAMQPECRQSSV
jgi:hypothetical protein